MKKKKILVLDLDETLIHSSLTKMPNSFKIQSKKSGITFYVSERPYLKEFMKQASKWYTLIVMTASLAGYANPIIDRVSKYGAIHGRYYRQHCSLVGGIYSKDLDIILKDFQEKIQNVMIIDNSPTSYLFQPDNAIPISSWVGSQKDTELLKYLTLLDLLRGSVDVRSILSFRV